MKLASSPTMVKVWLIATDNLTLRWFVVHRVTLYSLKWRQPPSLEVFKRRVDVVLRDKVE